MLWEKKWKNFFSVFQQKQRTCVCVIHQIIEIDYTSCYKVLNNCYRTRNTPTWLLFNSVDFSQFFNFSLLCAFPLTTHIYLSNENKFNGILSTCLSKSLAVVWNECVIMIWCYFESDREGNAEKECEKEWKRWNCMMTDIKAVSQDCTSCCVLFITFANARTMFHTIRWNDPIKRDQWWNASLTMAHIILPLRQFSLNLKNVLRRLLR